MRLPGQRQRNNLRAEAASDRIDAAKRDGEPIEFGDMEVAAVVRTTDVNKLPEPVREAADALLDMWSEDMNVGRKGEEPLL